MGCSGESAADGLLASSFTKRSLEKARSAESRDERGPPEETNCTGKHAEKGISEANPLTSARRHVHPLGKKLRVLVAEKYRQRGGAKARSPPECIAEKMEGKPGGAESPHERINERRLDQGLE